jgi:hypothetical protein
VLWVSPSQLAAAQRPLRTEHERPRRPDANAGPRVAEWVRRVRYESGILSIICLVHDDELELNYGRLGLHPKGLIGFYEAQGLQVRRVKIFDRPQEWRREKDKQLADMQLAADHFRELPKPVLVHCATGVDRTPPVAAYILLHCLR